MLTKNGGGDHKRRLSRVHCICTMHCVQCTLEKQCTANHVISCHSRHSTRGAGRRGRKRPRDGRPHSCCAGSIVLCSADRIVVNSYTKCPRALGILTRHWNVYPTNSVFFNYFLSNHCCSLGPSCHIREWTKSFPMMYVARQPLLSNTLFCLATVSEADVCSLTLSFYYC